MNARRELLGEILEGDDFREYEFRVGAVGYLIVEVSECGISDIEGCGQREGGRKKDGIEFGDGAEAFSWIGGLVAVILIVGARTGGRVFHRVDGGGTIAVGEDICNDS